MRGSTTISNKPLEEKLAFMADLHEEMGEPGDGSAYIRALRHIRQITAERDALHQRLNEADQGMDELQAQLDFAKTLMIRLLAASHASGGKASTPLTTWGINELDVVESEMAYYLNHASEAAAHG